MELKNFETLFHLCVAFNFLYSAFENFSRNLGVFFSDPFKKFGSSTVDEFSQKVQKIKDAGVIKNEGLDTKELVAKLEKYFIEVNKAISSLFNPVEYDMEYGSKFKSIYLLAGLFSFFLIIICGFDHYLNEEKIYQSLFVIDCLILIVILFVTFTTFRAKLKNIRAVKILILFILLVCFCSILYLYSDFFWLNNFVPSKNCSILFSVTIVLLPFFLHFIRILLQVLYIQLYLVFIRFTFRTKFQYVDSEINQIEYAQAVLNKYTTKKDEPSNENP